MTPTDASGTLRHRWRRLPDAVRPLAIIYVVAGVAAIANAIVLRPPPAPPGVFIGLGLIDIALGVTVSLLPWSRWSPRAYWWLIPPTLLLIQAFAAAGALTPETYPIFFIVLFIWVGISQPPSTAYLVAPLALAAYLLPLITHAPVGSVARSVGLVVPVGVLVAELISRAQRAAGDSDRRTTELEKARAAEMARNAVQEEVMERLNFQAALLEETPASLIATDLGGTITYWSPRSEKLFGYGSNEALGRDINDLTVFPQDENVAHEILATIAGGGRWTGEWRSPTKGGDEVWVWSSLTALRNQAGEVDGVLGTALDITQRKLAQERVGAVERRFEAFIENAPDGVLLFDEAGRFLYVSPAAATLMGRKPSELDGEDAFSPLHPEDRAVVRERFEDAARHGGIRGPMTFRVRQVDGSYRWVEATVTGLLHHPDVRGVVANFHDVTAMVEAREEIEASRQNLELILDQLPAVLWTTDRDLNLTSAKGRGLEDLELTLSDEEPVTILELAAASQVPEAITEAHQIALAGGTGSYEMIGFGRRQQCEVRPLRKGAEVVGVVGIALDVTAQHLLEEEFRQTQKLEAVGALAGGVAHDFNNLLAVILNYARFVMDGSTDDRVKADVEEIISAAESATSLTRRLLTFSRKTTPEVELVDVGGSLRSMEKIITRLLIESIELVVEVDDGDSTVEMDPSQLEQIMLNLAVNARDAMHGGGSLRIKAEKAVGEPGDAVGVVRLTVSDTGEGIPADVMERIFEPFFTTKDPAQGTGLGLAIVYGIVTQTGGRITVDSTVGEGTTFTIDLPAAGRTSSRAARVAPITRRLSPAAILLVEDDDALRKVIARMLRDMGHEVHKATDGEDALALMTELREPVDLLVTDVVMPKMTGFELSRRLDIPTLFMSGYPDAVLSQHGLRLSGIHFLRKPFTSAQLLSKIDEALAGPKKGRAQDAV